MTKKVKTKWKYIIWVDGKEVWRGLNPKNKYWEFKAANTNKIVSIEWVTSADVIVCLI